MNEPSKDIGSVLKKERERKGVSLETVHEATKIPIDSLKAIEEGYRVRTLTTFYYRSFVRIYAQYLGLNPEALVSQIASDLPQKKANLLRKEPVAKKSWESLSLRLPSRPINYKKVRKLLKMAGLLIGVALVIVLAFRLIHKLRSSLPPPAPAAAKMENKLIKKEKAAPARTAESPKKPDEKKKAEPAKPTEAVKPPETARPVEKVRPAEPGKAAAAEKKTDPVKPAEPAKTVAGENKSDTAKKAEPAKVPEVKAVANESKTSENKESKTEPVKSSPAANKTMKVSVAVRALNNAWLNVKADGAPVFQGILKKGTSDSWSAAKAIDISGKDINQLEFEVNGKPIGRLSRRGAPAKKIRITPDGLTVEK